MVKGAYDSDLAFAHHLADAAAAVSLSYFRRELRRWSKDDGSLATEADMAVEDTLRSCVGRDRSGDAVLGEERGQTSFGARRWIIDGIDGTVEFAAGQPEWGTLIALEVEGQVVCGVCDQPAYSRRYWATKGGGAFCSQRPALSENVLRVSAVGELSASRSYVPPARWLPDERAHRVAAGIAEATRQEPPIDHPALQVSVGSYELAVFFIAGPWDVAAPALIVEEAGGRFSDIEGRSDLTSGTAVFSNGRVHEAVLRLIAQTAGGSAYTGRPA